MPKETYEAAHEAWQETRKEVRTLQGHHQKLLNEKAEALADLDKHIKEIKDQYDHASKKLQGLHTRVQELLAAELQKDKGALNAGLNGD